METNCLLCLLCLRKQNSLVLLLFNLKFDKEFVQDNESSSFKGCVVGYTFKRTIHKASSYV